MKTASFGWEFDNINNNSVSASWPLKTPIILKGYQFDLGLMVTNHGPGIFSGTFAEVLFSAGIFSPLPLENDFGPAIFTPPTTGLKTGLHGNDMDQVGFCRAILKTFVGKSLINNSVNKVITISNLNILIPANATLTMNAGHAGYGPMDFEVQGCLYYDNA
jgi:hypothetical protein